MEQRFRAARRAAMVCVSIIGFSAFAGALFAPAAAEELGSPFDARDLKAGERWFTRDHPGGDQTLGHDLTIRRYIGDGKWTCNAANTDGSKNEHLPAWNKPIYAIEDGVVERCWRNNPDNEKPGVKDSRIGPGPNGVSSGGNHLLVRRPNGELLLYAHARKGTIDDKLCPVEDELLGAGQDKGYVFPEADRPTIKRGQYIGRVGNSGESTAPHLHIHSVTSSGGTPLALPMQRGLISEFTPTGSGDCNGEANINSWTKLDGSPIPQARVLFWPPRRVGREYTRIKYDDADFGRMFKHLADSGYQLAWLDGYSVGGDAFFNFVWKPATTQWRAFFGLTQSQFQTQLDQQKAAGYEPMLLDSYLRNGQVRYAIIFHKNAAGTWRVRSNRTAAQHQAIFDQAKADGLKPVSISVVSVNGERRYSALYRSNDIGSWQAKSAVKESDYQAVYDANKSAGRHPIYLNAYKHGSDVYVSTIFASKPSGTFRARHGMSAAQFDNEFDTAFNDGYGTEVITAFDGASSQHRYFGVWRKSAGPRRAR